LPGLSRKDDSRESDGRGGEVSGDGGIPRFRISQDELTKAAAEAKRFQEERAKEQAAGAGNAPSRHSQTTTTPRRLPDLEQLLAIFGGAVGLGSIFVLPLRFTLPTLCLALVAVGLKTRGGVRIAAAVLAFCAFGAAIGVWIVFLFGSGSSDSGLTSEAARAQTRLEIVGEVNRLRHQHHLKSLNYDPSLSLFAQQRADFGAASHSGFATEQTDAELSPSRETNVWAEMAGVACSWHHLFEMSEGTGPTPASPEIGFIEGGWGVGHGPHAYLSPNFSSLGVGLENIPGGDTSVVIDLTGRPQADRPWFHQELPNLLSEVVGHGDPPIPECD
jgi:hypothetical protein